MYDSIAKEKEWGKKCLEIISIKVGGLTPHGKKNEPSPKAQKVMLNCHKTKPKCLVNEIVAKSLERSTIHTFSPKN